MSATLATEDILIIETPERVPLHFALASIGNRFIACAGPHRRGLDHTREFFEHRSSSIERAEVGLCSHDPAVISDAVRLLRIL